MMMWLSLWILSVPGTAGAPPPANTARFVLIVANNDVARTPPAASGEVSAPSAAPLKYADDDGARYYEILSPYARRVELLTVLDDDSQRVFPRLRGQVEPPTRARLVERLSSMFAEIEAVRAAGTTRTELWFVFVGHGGLDADGHGYLHLQDGHWTRADLFGELFAKSPADLTHVVIDACHAYSLVAGRDGAQTAALQRELGDFLSGHDLADYPTVGVLVATSHEQETHEWSAWRAGVFSHQVRSALLGAADVNDDGQIEYSEVAAFVAAANSGLGPLGKAVEVFAWPPSIDRRAPLLDLRDGPVGYVVLDRAIEGHVFVEAEDGGRIADLHKTGDRALVLALPNDRSYFVRDEAGEAFVRSGVDVVRLTRLVPAPQPSGVMARAAVDQAFARGLFRVPFGLEFYRGFVAGRSQLLAVGEGGASFATSLGTTRVPKVDDEPKRLTRWELGAGYQVGSSPLRLDKPEHAVFARGALRFWPWLALGLGAEVGYSDLSGTASHHATRVGLWAGPRAEYEWDERVVGYWSLELGWAWIELVAGVPGGTNAVAGGTDPTVLAGRTGVGAGVRVLGPVWLTLQGVGFLHLVSAQTGETWLGGFGGQLGVAIRN